MIDRIMLPQTYRTPFILLISLLSVSDTFAQQYNIKTYTVEDGLAQTGVEDIIQDKNGYIWFATAGGVSRFNGRSFQNFTTAEGLINNRVAAMMEDREGYIWVGTIEGISIINPKSDTLEIINITTKNGLIGNVVSTIFQDSKGFIWFGTNQGISILDPDQYAWKIITHVQKFTIDFQNITTEDGLVNNSINDIFEDHEGNFWFATNGGVSKLVPPAPMRSGSDSEGSPPMFTNFTVEDGLSHNVVHSIVEDKEGVVWLATEKNITMLVPDKNEPSGMSIDIINTGKISLDKDKSCILIFEDKQGNLWFSCVGLVKLARPARLPKRSDRQGSDGQKYDYFGVSTGVENVHCLFEDREGNLWIGLGVGGVLRYRNKSLLTYTTAHGMSSDNVRAIVEDKKGNIWIGTSNGMSKLVLGDSEGSYHPPGFEIFRQNTSGVLNDGLIGNSVWSLLSDSRGNIWVGMGHGITKYTPASGKGKKGKFENFNKKHGLKDPATMALLEDSHGNIWAATFHGAAKFSPDVLQTGEKRLKLYTSLEGLIHNFVSAIHEDSRGNLWFGTSDGISRCKVPSRDSGRDAQFGRLYQNPGMENDSLVFENFTTQDGLVNNRVLSIVEDNEGNIWFGTMRGISKYTYSVNSLSKGNFKNFNVKDGLSSDTPYLLIFDDEGYLYVGTNLGVDKFFVKGSSFKKIKHFGKLEGFSGIETNHNAACKDHYGNIWFGTMGGAIKYDPGLDQPNRVEPLTHISKLQLFLENFDYTIFSDSVNAITGLPEGLDLPYNKNHLTFHFTALSLTIPEKVRYKWKMEKFSFLGGSASGGDIRWSPVTQKTEATYSNLLPGSYIFMIKACNNDGLWNKNPTTFSFIISPPFWQTWWFYLLCIFSASGSVYGFVKIRERNLKREKKILKEKVEIRTRQLQGKNIELEEKNQTLAKKNKQITDSINYARRIQQAILPSDDEIKKHLHDSFILFKPRDVVSGDFYWLASLPVIPGAGKGRSVGVNEESPESLPVIVAAVDCTGHGVPGAFMSMIGNTLLNEIVNEKGITKPSEILAELNTGIKKALHQNGQETRSDDGMDISLVSIDPEKRRISFAGAGRPLYIASNGILNEIKGNPHGIGGGRKKIIKNFTHHEYTLKKGDTFYLFSDGYIDQFGGEENRKFMIERFEKLLLDINHLTMQEQFSSLENSFEEWKGSGKQIDDVLVIGVKV
ncbi:MAG: SpoIIE family protein phosphatase [Cytophagales bacterium]|nr:SpoIIE family protein phosphatase [Cytophagales bacterium]